MTVLCLSEVPYCDAVVCRIVVASSRQAREETDKARNSIPTSTSLICFSMTNPHLDDKYPHYC